MADEPQAPQGDQLPIADMECYTDWAVPEWFAMQYPAWYRSLKGNGVYLRFHELGKGATQLKPLIEPLDPTTIDYSKPINLVGEKTAGWACYWEEAVAHHAQQVLEDSKAYQYCTSTDESEFDEAWQEALQRPTPRTRLDPYVTIGVETTPGVALDGDSLARQNLIGWKRELNASQDAAEEQWWLDAQAACLEAICTAFAIPADYLTDERRVAVNTALDTLREAVEERVNDITE